MINPHRINTLLSLFVFCIPLETGCNSTGLSGKLFGRGPKIDKVSIEPKVPNVDGPVTCSVDTKDVSVSKEFRWKNMTNGRELGSGAKITLDPDRIDPGDTLRCEVTIEDQDGHTATDHADVEPGCGFYDTRSLADVDITIHIFFRPVITEDLIPGYGGEPWDWDGNIPDWILDVTSALSDILGAFASVYPDPDIIAAAEVAGQVDKILDVIDTYGPELLRGTVPPDPNLYPYLYDDAGNLYSYNDVGDGFSWDDSYEVELSFSGQDFRSYAGLAIDMEDRDLAFNDNMGDYLDQQSDPLILSSQIFANTAYCTSTYYNPGTHTQSSKFAVIPSSILWMSIEVN